jgi:site-specific DNA recombinase
MCREYASRKGWLVVEELAEDDRGASGASLDLPQLNRLIEMAQARQIDVVVVREIDRFSRTLAKQLIIEEQLKRCGVEIEYVLGEYPDTPEGSLNKNIKAVIAEYERLKIAERMSRGREQKVKSGHVMAHGRRPYGYQIVHKDGKQTLEVHEPEAAIVKLVFQWYTDGDEDLKPLSIRAIARKLSGMAVPTYADTVADAPCTKVRPYGAWSPSTISHMLKKAVYMGRWRYGKNGRVKGVRVNRDTEDLIGVEVPAIVSPEQWKAAQRRQQMNESSGRPSKHNFLLGRRSYCGVCGSKMHGELATTSYKRNRKEYLYYRCLAWKDYAVECTQRLHFRADHVDALVWEWIWTFLTDPATLLKGLQDFQAGQEEATRPLTERLAAVRGVIEDNQRQLGRVLDIYMAGDFPLDLLMERKNRLEVTLAKLEKEQADLVATIHSQTVSNEVIDDLGAFAQQASEGLLEIDSDFDTKRRIIERLGVTATLFVNDDGQRFVRARCILSTESTELLGLLSSRISSIAGRAQPSCGTSPSGRRLRCTWTATGWAATSSSSPARPRSIHMRHRPTRRRPTPPNTSPALPASA